MSEHSESERGRFKPNRCILRGDRRQTVCWHHLAQTEVHSDLHMVKNANNCEQRLHTLNIDARNLNLCDLS